MLLTGDRGVYGDEARAPAIALAGLAIEALRAAIKASTSRLSSSRAASIDIVTRGVCGLFHAGFLVGKAMMGKDVLFGTTLKESLSVLGRKERLEGRLGVCVTN